MVLTCEMCGSSLDRNKAINDVITCEYCDSATNINGFIHLNMSNDDRAAALMKRGFVLIEFKVWDKAKYVLDKAVEYDKKNAKAYLGLLMIDMECTKEEQLSLGTKVFTDNVNYQKSLEFADAELRARLQAYDAEVVERKRLADIKREEQQRRWKKREDERNARIEREEAKKRRFRKRLIISGVSLMIVIGIAVMIGQINRARTLEYLSNYTDLTSVIQLVKQESNERELEKRGLTASNPSNTRFLVNNSLVNRAGFAGITFHESNISLREVTKFSDIDFTSPRAVVDGLYQKYGIEASLVESGGEMSIPSGGSLSFLEMSQTPSIAEINFVKDGVPVEIRRVREYYICWESRMADARSPGNSSIGNTFALSPFESTTTWTVVVGSH
jgi:hypothetical protein